MRLYSSVWRWNKLARNWFNFPHNAYAVCGVHFQSCEGQGHARLVRLSGSQFSEIGFSSWSLLKPIPHQQHMGMWPEKSTIFIYSSQLKSCEIVSARNMIRYRSIWLIVLSLNKAQRSTTFRTFQLQFSAHLFWCISSSQTPHYS